MKRLIKSLVIVGISVVLWGCSTVLDPTGPYNGDTFLYNSDQSVVQAYNLTDAFLKWETANNPYVKANMPSVFNTANSIRTNAPIALTLVNIERNLYISLKGSTNTTALAQASNGLASAVLSYDSIVSQIPIVTVPAVTNALNTVLPTPPK